MPTQLQYRPPLNEETFLLPDKAAFADIQSLIELEEQKA